MVTYHFNESDWAACQPPCRSDEIDPDILSRLEYARSLCGFPFKITSAFRSVEYEHEKGRSGSSSHCKGLAVDISCYSSENRYIMVQNLLRAGFTRIGISNTFIHVDRDLSKPPSIWLY